MEILILMPLILSTLFLNFFLDTTSLFFWFRIRFYAIMSSPKGISYFLSISLHWNSYFVPNTVSQNSFYFLFIFGTLTKIDLIVYFIQAYYVASNPKIRDITKDVPNREMHAQNHMASLTPAMEGVVEHRFRKAINDQ